MASLLKLGVLVRGVAVNLWLRDELAGWILRSQNLVVYHIVLVVLVGLTNCLGTRSLSSNFIGSHPLGRLLVPTG